MFAGWLGDRRRDQSRLLTAAWFACFITTFIRSNVKRSSAIVVAEIDDENGNGNLYVDLYRGRVNVSGEEVPDDASRGVGQVHGQATRNVAGLLLDRCRT